MQGVPEHSAQAVSNRQTQPKAFFGAGLVAVQAFEFFKNHLQLVLRDTGAAIPDLQAQVLAATPHAQQYRALGVTEGVGQEVLQDAPQQLDVAADPQAAATYPELEALLLCLGGKFGAQGIEQVVDCKRLDVGCEFAVFQSGNIQQVADQVLG